MNIELLKNLLEYFDFKQFLASNPPLKLLTILGIMAAMAVAAHFLCAIIHRILVKMATARLTQSAGKKAAHEHGKVAANLRAYFDVALFSSVMKNAKWLLYMLICYWGSKSLNLGVLYAEAVDIIFTSLCTLFAISFIASFAPFEMDIYCRRRGTTLSQSQTRSLLPIIKGVIWATGLTFLLDNLGCHVATIIAGLGIVGVAVGLAGQAILSDFFSYLVLLIDRPFRIGDFIVLPDGRSGDILYMGPKTTRLRGLDGNEIICANSEMTKGVIVNQGNVSERMVTVEVGVAYTVAMPIVRKVPQVLREVIESFPQCTFQRACMLNFGAENYLFQLIYRVASDSEDIEEFMQIQSDVNLAFTEKMSEAGMTGAYPTESILFTSTSPLSVTNAPQTPAATQQQN